MFITYGDHEVRFKYGSKQSQFTFDENAAIGLVRQRKNYFWKNIICNIFFALSYYLLFFANLKDLFIFILILASSGLVLAIRCWNPVKYSYHVVIYKNNKMVLRIKIKNKDKNLIKEKIKQYEEIMSARMFQKAL